MIKHAFDVGTNVPVCKTKHVKAFCAERHIPFIVLWDFVSVAIDLNHEAFGGAEEVDNEIADHMLAPELEAAELRTAEMFPEDFFKRCSILDSCFANVLARNDELHDCGGAITNFQT